MSGKAALDEELERLPESLRAPLILCYLDGQARDEAAQQLGLSVGCLHGRLERGRKALCVRLLRRGVSLAAALMATALGEGIARAALSPTVVLSTAKTALLLGCGRAVDKGLVSTKVVALTQEVLRNMVVTKLKHGAALVLALAFLTGGVGLAIGHRPSALSEQPEKSSPAAESSQPAGQSRRPAADLFDDPLPTGALARMGTVRLRQPAQQVAFAADGKALVGTSADHRISMWEVGTGKYLQGRVIEGTQDFDQSATTLAPDGKAVLVWLWSRQSLLVCEVPTGKKLGCISLRAGQPYRAAVAPGGKAVAASVHDGRKHVIRVWDMATGTERQPR